MLTLTELLKDFPDLLAQLPQQQITVNNIQHDSRCVQQNDLFVAKQGFKADGSQFIQNAIDAGAKVIITSQKQTTNQSTTLFLQHPNPEEILGHLLAIQYPNKPQNLVAVTGSNGKTTVTQFLMQIFAQLKLPSAAIGTLGVQYTTPPNQPQTLPIKDELTVRDIVDNHKILQQLKQLNINHAFLEATSQGIINHRLDHIPFNVAIFTNFSRDHVGSAPGLHPTMQDYLNAKLQLFEKLLPPQTQAILNADMPEYNQIKQHCNHLNIITFGKQGQHVKIKEITNNNNQQLVTLEINQKTHTINFPLQGYFQILNLAAALSVLVAYKLEHLIPEINFETIKSAQGRMQKVATTHNNAHVYIDYATSPDALQNTIAAFKNNPNVSRVLVLFGAGGDRDPGKRPEMGRIVTTYADYAIVTDDNPRTEDPSKIRQNILAGCLPNKAIEITNGRTQAIKYAITLLKPNDVLILAAKGHERYMIIGTEKQPFNEYEIVKENILAQNGTVYPQV